ncbi:Hpt domain-containing protein [Salinihabitans flavidus]|uniref:Hpt domain-containing protein n=1 Tax=Salinihabitans flavidus TaxID=569882 RepID=A0A1H8LXC0_9RHOB|nr:Hpt domain-containing protein [Salinihabitans flavidus]SEO09784.1 Hpt domain-containing protein [Salinihabitans flavidus]
MIDWSQVKALHNEIGAQDFDEVVEMFMQEAQETIARLRTVPHPETLEAELHHLKGSALNLGFRGFAALCHAGEALAAEGMAQQVALAEIAAQFMHSRRLFDEGLAQALAA